MDTVFRALGIYIFLLVVFRISGKRTLSEITTFDLVLTLIISEAVQQAMIINDYSVTNALLLVSTLVAADIVLAWSKQRSVTLSRILEGTPTVVIEDGSVYHDRMRRECIDEGDILQAARELQGLERMDDIKHAVVELSGGISIVPRRKEGS